MAAKFQMVLSFSRKQQKNGSKICQNLRNLNFGTLFYLVPDSKLTSVTQKNVRFSA